MLHDEKLSRRTVIASATFVPVTALTSAVLTDAALTAAAQAPKTAALSAQQRQILDAFVDRLVPEDALGPGALEMGAANYIDLALAEALAGEKDAITAGLTGVDTLARKEFDAPFTELPPERKDQVLAALENESRAFFNRIRRLTLEGMFCDPYYGGNKNYAGWDLIRYPGPRLAVGPEDQKMSTPPKPLHQSAYGSNFNRGH